MGLCCLLNWHDAGYEWSNLFCCYKLLDLLFISNGCMQDTAADDAYPFEPPCLGIDSSLLSAQVANQDNAGVRSAGVETRLQGRADKLDDEVHPTLLLQDLRDIIGAIDNQIRSQLAQRCRSFFAAGRCCYPGSDMFRELDRDCANAAGTRPDEDAFSWLQAAKIEQTAPGRGGCEPCCNRLLKRNFIRDAYQIC